MAPLVSVERVRDASLIGSAEPFIAAATAVKGRGRLNPVTDEVNKTIYEIYRFKS
jgi:hypothetical protein